ncbi:unnamed protein product [Brassicogethes aeneus]|uniref:SET domain-containing protein n=1 Tax=Brassicogethes aeneus TaxID=1431903 RepID=A0A9P0BCB2_BRAAE|nr:unnamed protein product [Brassicogethes aeneus]
MKRTPEAVTEIIKTHLEANGHKIANDSENWCIKKSSLGGLGVFATKNIQPGDFIFKDYPVIIGPRSKINKDVCVVCFKDEPILCSRNCHLPVCSKECENSKIHLQECELIRKWSQKKCESGYNNLIKYITPIRTLFLSENEEKIVKSLQGHKGSQHGFEVDALSYKYGMVFSKEEEHFMKLACRVMDSNAFEVIIDDKDNQSGVRGLYPLSALSNHDCSPNTFYTFDKDHWMILRASKPIQTGEEICNTYVKRLWGTLNRKLMLEKSKHFSCTCKRCRDPTEFGSYVSAMRCSFCKVGFILPINPLDINSSWICDVCASKTNCQKVGKILSLLGNTLASFGNDDVEIMMRFLNGKLLDFVHVNHYIVLELKCKVIFILGNRKNYELQNISDSLLELKHQYCRDFLNLTEKLRLGYFTYRAQIISELVSTLKEESRRKNNTKTEEMDKEINMLLNDLYLVSQNEFCSDK